MTLAVGPVVEPTLPAGKISVEEEELPKQGTAYLFIKRTFDIIVSVLCLTVGLPVYFLIAIAIIIDSPGNPLFVQERVGKNGKVFRMIKFRTMQKDADAKKIEFQTYNQHIGVHFKMDNDPRVTKVGKFLRKTSLDEIPQAINILLGSMTIVGPRPFVPSEQSQLSTKRLCVKPGLSCYWQLLDTTKMSDEEQLELDYKYIHECGIWTDLKIIFQTVKIMFVGRNG